MKMPSIFCRNLSAAQLPPVDQQVYPVQQDQKRRARRKQALLPSCQTYADAWDLQQGPRDAISAPRRSRSRQQGQQWLQTERGGHFAGQQGL